MYTWAACRGLVGAAAELHSRTLLALIARNGVPPACALTPATCPGPALQELEAAGRRDLVAAITRCGGAQKLAEHLQLPYTEMRGRRKRGEQAAVGRRAGESFVGQASGAAAVGGSPAQQPHLHPGFVAARLRQPPGLAISAAGAAEGSTAGACVPQVPSGSKAQGPASALLERELIVDAYTDVTFV